MKKIFKKVFWFFDDSNEYNLLYKTVSLIGLIIRVAIYPLILPDVFEIVAEFVISKFGIPELWYQIFLRLALLIIDAASLSNIFYWISYITVGNSYERGAHTLVSYPFSYKRERISHAWWGSLCYTLYYGAYMAMAGFIIKFFNWEVIIVAFAGYLILSIFIYLMSAFVVKTLPILWELRLIAHCAIFALVVAGTCLLKYYVF